MRKKIKKKNYLTTNKNFYILQNYIEKIKEQKEFPPYWYTSMFLLRFGFDPIALLISLLISSELKSFFFYYILLLIVIHLPFELKRARKIVNQRQSKKIKIIN